MGWPWHSHSHGRSRSVPTGYEKVIVRVQFVCTRSWTYFSAERWNAGRSNAMQASRHAQLRCLQARESNSTTHVEALLATSTSEGLCERGEAVKARQGLSIVRCIWIFYRSIFRPRLVCSNRFVAVWHSILPNRVKKTTPPQIEPINRTR